MGTIKYMLQMGLLKKKRSFAKYLFPFREFTRLFLQKRSIELQLILDDLVISLDFSSIGVDMIDLLLSFVYDDMSYLRNVNQDEDLRFVNNSLKQYESLSQPWKRFVFDEYALKLPKEELAKLDYFAYLCYL